MEHARADPSRIDRHPAGARRLVGLARRLRGGWISAFRAKVGRRVEGRKPVVRARRRGDVGVIPGFIIEVMCEKLGLGPQDLAATEAVLAEHGNMSSVTVLFVLDEILRGSGLRCGEKGVLGAFGPGFGAEFALLEFAC